MAKGRLQQELSELEKQPLPNCSAWPDSGSGLQEWTGAIMGPDDSPYQGGLFFLKLRFSHNYPKKPPQVFFMTGIYHFCVDSSGKTCPALLYEDWKPAFGVREILCYFFTMLSTPDEYNLMLPDLYQLYKTDRAGYEDKAYEVTRKYAT